MGRLFFLKSMMSSLAPPDMPLDRGFEVLNAVAYVSVGIDHHHGIGFSGFEHGVVDAGEPAFETLPVLFWQAYIDAVEKPDETLVDVYANNFFGSGHHSESKIARAGADVGHRFITQVAEHGNDQFRFLPDAPLFALEIGDEAFKVARTGFGQGQGFGHRRGGRRFFAGHAGRIVRIDGIVPAGGQQCRRYGQKKQQVSFHNLSGIEQSKSR